MQPTYIMNNFQKSQSEKILSIYNNVEDVLEKGRKSEPIGTIRGNYIKQAHGWEYVKKKESKTPNEYSGSDKIRAYEYHYRHANYGIGLKDEYKDDYRKYADEVHKKYESLSQDAKRVFNEVVDFKKREVLDDKIINELVDTGLFEVEEGGWNNTKKYVTQKDK